eukprot:TRINITY_DN5191_c0_g1_i6.p1 TRINITY_DN5191_c0_g1~~TRINITY_DN5191_c0_g1_i6.p1  ORF type:complete len:361 (-),score=54.40 TRINITY_DN5191_c0_g1_i6:825-1907(-)
MQQIQPRKRSRVLSEEQKECKRRYTREWVAKNSIANSIILRIRKSMYRSVQDKEKTKGVPKVKKSPLYYHENSEKLKIKATQARKQRGKKFSELYRAEFREKALESCRRSYKKRREERIFFHKLYQESRKEILRISERTRARVAREIPTSNQKSNLVTTSISLNPSSVTTISSFAIDTTVPISIPTGVITIPTQTTSHPNAPVHDDKKEIQKKKRKEYHRLNEEKISRRVRAYTCERRIMFNHCTKQAKDIEEANIIRFRKEMRMDLETKLNVRSMEDWKIIPVRLISEIVGKKVFRLLSKKEFLKLLYPGEDWNNFLPSVNLWRNPTRLRNFLNKIKTKFNILTKEDWYSLSVQQVDVN